MKMSPAFRKVFVQRLTKVLSGGTVWASERLIIDKIEDWEALDSSFDQNLFATLKGYISDTPIRDFVRDFVEHRLREQILVPGGQVTLGSVAGFHDLAAVSEEIFDALQGIPFNYAFLIPLPGSLSDQMPADGVWKLSDQFQIVKGAGLHKTYEVRTITEGRVENFGREHAAWSITGAYLAVQSQGFVDGGYQNHPFHRTMEAVRSFLGLGLALGLFQYSPLFLTQNTPPWAMIDKKIGEDFAFERALRLPTALTATFNCLVFIAPKATEPPSQWAYVVGRHLVTLKHVLSNASNFSRMARAAQWHFDSLGGDNELLQFVQSMVALEILVGGTKEENKRVGVGELMRNRIAYLIGTSIEERGHIMETFDAIYDIRSSIVHAGHSRLTSDQRVQLWTLRDYVARVIRAEAALMTPDRAYLGAGWTEAGVPPFTFNATASELASLAPPQPQPRGILPDWL